MELWDWQAFGDQFSAPVLAAPVALSVLWAVLFMLVKRVYGRWPQIVSWILFPLTAFLLVAVSLATINWMIKHSRYSELDRPHFTKTASMIHYHLDGNDMEPRLPTLTVSVENHGMPVKGVISRMLILDALLAPSFEPLKSQFIEAANEIGQSGLLNHYAEIDPGWLAGSAFVVFEIQYTWVLTGKTYYQVWFMKFTGSPQVNFPKIFSADVGEREKIKSYLRQRGIKMLADDVL